LLLAIRARDTPEVSPIKIFIDLHQDKMNPFLTWRSRIFPTRGKKKDLNDICHTKRHYKIEPLQLSKDKKYEALSVIGINF
jgi:hypothetical protein